MLEVLYCCKCQEHLNEYGEFASDVFIGICNFYLLYERPFLISTDIHVQNHGLLEVLRFLELKNYVISTEWEKELISFKPLGVSCVDQEEDHKVCHICFEREKHA
jgi:hypothetical protein